MSDATMKQGALTTTFLTLERVDEDTVAVTFGVKVDGITNVEGSRTLVVPPVGGREESSRTYRSPLYKEQVTAPDTGSAAVEITLLTDSERHFVCPACGREWTEAYAGAER